MAGWTVTSAREWRSTRPPKGWFLFTFSINYLFYKFYKSNGKQPSGGRVNRNERTSKIFFSKFNRIIKKLFRESSAFFGIFRNFSEFFGKNIFSKECLLADCLSEKCLSGNRYFGKLSLGKMSNNPWWISRKLESGKHFHLIRYTFSEYALHHNFITRKRTLYVHLYVHENCRKI